MKQGIACVYAYVVFAFGRVTKKMRLNLEKLIKPNKCFYNSVESLSDEPFAILFYDSQSSLRAGQDKLFVLVTSPM